VYVADAKVMQWVCDRVDRYCTVLRLSSGFTCVEFGWVWVGLCCICRDYHRSGRDFGGGVVDGIWMGILEL
jgi:hypothetical protein